jgi:hypothetical protein
VARMTGLGTGTVHNLKREMAAQSQSRRHDASPLDPHKAAANFATPNTPASCQVQKSQAHSFDAESGSRRARRGAHALTQLAHLCLRLPRPVGHAHFAVHLYRGGEMLLRLLEIAIAAMQFAETEVAMGDKRTHAAGLS